MAICVSRVLLDGLQKKERRLVVYYFAGKPPVASRDVVCFLRLPNDKYKINSLLSWRDKRGSAVSFWRRSREKGGYTSQFEVN